MVSPSPHSCLSGLGQGAWQEPHWAPVAVLVGSVGRQEPRPSAGSPRAWGAQGPIDYLPASTCQTSRTQQPRAQARGALSSGDAIDPQTWPLGQPSRPDVPERGLMCPGQAENLLCMGTRCHLRSRGCYTEYLGGILRQDQPGQRWASGPLRSAYMNCCDGPFGVF